jgi:hypothetical protein
MAAKEEVQYIFNLITEGANPVIVRTTRVKASISVQLAMME